MLTRNIRSVLAQTFCNYEHIIIDDANDTATERLVEDFNDDRIVLIKHDRQKGAAAAYNSGINHARGIYITFLDDDDEYLPDFLENVNNFFIHINPEIRFVWTGIAHVEDSGNIEQVINSRIWPSSFDTIEDGLVAATTIGNGYGLCIKRECIQMIGLYDESLLFGQDADFLFRLAKSYKFATISSVLVRIHHHKGLQLTDFENNHERLRMREAILLKHGDLIQQYPSLYTIHYRHIADLSYRLKLKTKGRNILFRLISQRPFYLKNYLDFFAYELSGIDFSSMIHMRTIKRCMEVTSRKLSIHES